MTHFLKPWKAWTLIVVGALYLPGAGCDLFGTREPEEADQIDFVFTQPTGPEDTIENLENAFEQQVFNEYRNTLTDDFLFTPETGDVAQMETEFPGLAVFDEWNADVEVETAEAIAGTALNVDLRFILIGESIQPEGRQVRYRYFLTLTRPGDVEELYQGQAWFTVDAFSWSIRRWEDKADPEAPDGVERWGLLKGRNRLF